MHHHRVPLGTVYSGREKGARLVVPPDTTLTVRFFFLLEKGAAMKSFSRRKLIVGATAGAATAGVLAMVPHLGQHPPAAAATTNADPLMVYVTNPASAQVTMLVGNKEITFRDPALVAQLLRAAQR